MHGKLISLIGIGFVGTNLLIAQPSVTILSPASNVRWSATGTYPIRWAVTAVDTIRIDYSTTGVSGPWTVIVSGIPSSSNSPQIQSEHQNDTFTRTGSFYWTISFTSSDSCYIRISHKSNAAVFDIKRFVITPYKYWIVQVSDVDLPLYTVQAVNEGIGWAGGKDGLILKTVDSGIHWRAAGMIAGDVHTLTAVDASLAVAGSVSTSGAGRVFRTENGGSSWSIVDTTNTVWRHIRLFNNRIGYALGDPVGGFWVLKRTTNGGSTWIDVQPRVPASAGEEGRYNAMAWRDSLRGWFGTNASRVYRTTDGGATWISVPIQFGISVITAMCFSSNSYGLVGTASGSISRTTDGGASWSPGTSSLPSAVLGLSALTLTHWAVCKSNVYWSQDSGKTWLSTTFDGYGGLVPLNHLSLGGTSTAGYGWAVGNEGTIIRFRRFITDVSGRVSGIPHTHMLYQNYPNPFNPTTRIEYSIPKTSHVSLKVFDLLGREVATLVDEVQDSGLKTVEFSAKGGSASGGDASGLASGVYLYRLQAGNFVETKKLLLLR